MKDQAAEQLIGNYLQRATRHLWGRERSTVREELENHIRTRIAAHRLTGLNETDAVHRTLAELGEPEAVNDGMARLYVIPAVIGTSLSVGFRQFRTRPLESLLIVFALALGVGVVAAVTAFLGVSDQLAGLFRDSLEARELMVQAAENDDHLFSGDNARKAVRLGFIEREMPVLTLADLEEIKAAAPTVSYAYTKAPELLRSPTASVNNILAGALRIFGVTEDFFAASGITVEAGSLFSNSDYSESRRVLLMTEEALEQRRITGDPIGRVMSPGRPHQDFTIVGVLRDSQNLSSIQAGFFPVDPAKQLNHLFFAVDDPRLVPQARAEVQAYLEKRWGDAVTVSSQPGLRPVSDSQRLGAWVIAVFASVGLLVAALNIMNLMLARLLKRSRSLGILRSLGASRAVIRNQILIETGLLGLLGGAAGVGVGYLLLAAYNRYLQIASGGVLQGVSFSLLAMFLAVLLALVASLLFGLYPALQASRLRIVDVLGER